MMDNEKNRKLNLLFNKTSIYAMKYGLKVIKWVVFWPISLSQKFKKHHKCPPIKNRLLLISAGELADEIRNKKVTCEEVIRTYIQRVQEVNPMLNCLVQDRFSDAVQEARAVDQMLATTSLTAEDLLKIKPLLGVPLTVKESIAVKGMSNNAARSTVEENIATEDAEIVRLLREAGAIPLLVSNTPELCMCWETFNPKIGRTNNPYDTRRTPGGSSGGEAALLGAGASVIGVASDIGGSLRLPAMFTGVYGHKPTPGFVSNSGHMPSSKDKMWDSYFTLGPMVRYAADLPLMLNTIISDKTKAAELRLHEDVDISQLKVYYTEDESTVNLLTDPVNSEIISAMRKAVLYLERKYSIRAKKVQIPGVKDVIKLTALVMGRMNGIQNIFQKDESNPDEWNSVTWEFMKSFCFQSSSSLLALLYGPVKSTVDNISESDYERLIEKKTKLMKDFEEMLGDNGVFLYPTFVDAAHTHYEIFHKIFNVAYLCLFNLLELPVTQCPLNLNSQGLPIGMQIAAGRRQDRLTFAVAKALEEEFSGWIPPQCAEVIKYKQNNTSLI
uniref:Amidase domain-containing protein n=1 Tax=Clastoptera arizonana TaxID=38151 RepID=A0A1B6DM41_9HEMI